MGNAFPHDLRVNYLILLMVDTTKYIDLDYIKLDVILCRRHNRFKHYGFSYATERASQLFYDVFKTMPPMAKYIIEIIMLNLYC